MARERAIAKAAKMAEAAKAEKEEKDVVKETAGQAKKEVGTEEKEVKEVKKTPAKRTTKKEIKVKTYVQYMGKEVEEKEMISAVKKNWTKLSGKKVGDIKEICLYVKPEEAAVYYVVNGTDSGKVEF